MATLLEVLNGKLKDSKLALPSHRSAVDKSGSNLPWLRKHVMNKPQSNDELNKLLATDFKDLVHLTDGKEGDDV